MDIGWFVILFPVAVMVIYAITYPVRKWIEDKYNERYKNWGQQHGGKGNKIHRTLGDIIKGREF